MAKQLGQFNDLYVAATSPASPSTIANYTAVGETAQYNVNRTRAAIEAANFDSGYDDDVLPGRRSGTLTFTAHFDVSVDAGQEVVLDAFETAGGDLWWLAFPTGGTTGDALEYGHGVVTRVNKTAATDSLITLEVEVRIRTIARGTKA